MVVLRVLARLVSFVVCLALAVALFLMLALATGAVAAQRMLTPEPYRTVLSEQRVYERLPELVGAQLSRQIEAGSSAESEAADPSGAPDVVKRLTAAEWTELITTLLPPGWLEAQVDAVLTAVLADPPRAEARIDLVPLREHLSAGAARDAYRVLARGLPQCESGADQEFDLGRLGTCRPTTGAAGDLTEADLDAALGSEVAKMPDSAAIPLPRQLGEGEPGAPRVELGSVRTALIAAALAPLLPVALLLAVVRRRSALRWIGVPALLAGMLVFSVALAGSSALQLAEGYARSQVPAYWTPSMTDALAGVARALGHLVLDTVMIAAACAALLGFVLVAASFGWRRRAAVARADEPQPVLS